MSMHPTSLLSLNGLQHTSALSSVQTHTLRNFLPSRSESLVISSVQLQDIKEKINTLQCHAEQLGIVLVRSYATELEQDRARNALHLKARLDGLQAQLDDVRAVLDRLENSGI